MNDTNHPARRLRHGDRPTEPLTFEDAAANNAAEEGGLQGLPELLREASSILDGKQEMRFPIVDELDGFASILEAIAADRASRQVANKAEVIGKIMPEKLTAEMWRAWEGISNHLSTNEMNEIYAAMYEVTPPATTGASPVLTDERIIFETWAREVCNMPDYANVNWDALWTKQAWEGWQARSKIAAQAGQVAVPEGWTITKESNVITVEHPAVGKSTLASLALETAAQTVLYHLADQLLSPSPAKESK